MNTEKILALADHMERVSKRNYDQNNWHDGLNSRIATISRNPTIRRAGNSEALYYAVTPKREFCNTSACVLGHAPYVEGIDLQIVSLWVDTNESGRRETGGIDVAKVEDGVILGTAYRAAHLEFDIPMSHAKVLFGSTEEVATAIFYTGEIDSDEWVSPQVVADKLREYVASNGDSVDSVLRQLDVVPE